MEIIGEKINGSVKSVANAIAQRNTEYIQYLACRQAEAGADWLDIHAGTTMPQEMDDLIWLIETVQTVVDLPLCLDSPDPQALSEVIAITNRTPMINSVNGAASHLDILLPLIAKFNCRFIALAMDGMAIPATVAERITVIKTILNASRAANIPDEHVYVDPLVLMLSTQMQSAIIFCDTVREVHARYPEVHFTAGVSNSSFGLPARALINQAFLTLAVTAGMDCAILDPTDRNLRATLCAAELVAGKDCFCMNYTEAFRAGMFDHMIAQSMEPNTYIIEASAVCGHILRELAEVNEKD